MSYYQNSFYPNYNAYGNYNYNPQPQMAAVPPQQATANNVSGKLVDSIEVVKASEVPFGGYGLFPKADLSEIYIKSWNNNGTTRISVYKPLSEDDMPEQKQEDFNAVILQKVAGVEQKIDAIISAMSGTPQSQKVTEEKKDVNVNAY